MTDAMVAVLAKGGVGAVSVLVAMIVLKLIDKYRPKSVVAAEEASLRRNDMEDLRGQVGYWRTEVEKCQKDITDLRVELRKMSAERHYFYDAIVRCSVEHPHTADWWQVELAKIQAKIG